MGGPVRHRWWVLLGALACLGAARKPVVDKATRDAAVFRKHVAAARKHFKVGEFDRAAKEWTWAYKLKPVPPLLFNQAQAYRLAGHFEEARFAYTTYLNELPDAPNKAEVQGRIRTMTRYLHHPPKYLKNASDKTGQADD